MPRLTVTNLHNSSLLSAIGTLHRTILVVAPARLGLIQRSLNQRPETSTVFTYLGWLTIVLILSGCDQTGTTYFPLDSDRHWQYTIQRTTMDRTVTQKYLIETIADTQFNGLTLKGKRTLDGHHYFYSVDNHGVRRVAHQLSNDLEIQLEDPSFMVLPHDPQIGASWQQPTQTSVLENSAPPWETLFRIVQAITMTYTVESVSDVVNVPAGEFQDCLRIVGNGQIDTHVGNYIGQANIAVKVTEWYAPDVGLVRLQRYETTDTGALDFGSLHVELESY